MKKKLQLPCYDVCLHGKAFLFFDDFLLQERAAEGSAEGSAIRRAGEKELAPRTAFTIQPPV